MAPTIFVFSLLVLVTLSANHAYRINGPKGNHDWAKECEDRTYCWIRTPAYNQLNKTFERVLRGEVGQFFFGEETDHRRGFVQDVAHCEAVPGIPLNITMIKDENNITWYVPQTDNFTVQMTVAGCKDRIVTPKTSYLDENRLKNTKVQCVEQIFHFKFPVLSKDQSKIESEALAPYKGIPLHCSAKILKNVL